MWGNMTDFEELSRWLDSLAMPSQLDRSWLLNDFLMPLGVETDTVFADLCEDIVVGAAAADSSAFHMRAGAWRIDVSGTVTRTLLAAAFLGAALAAIGTSDIPEELYPAVLPLLVDVERIRVSRRDKALLAPLRNASQGVEGIALNPQVLYARLDPSVRSQLCAGDFEDLCERLVEAGHLDDGGYGDVRARATSEPAWIRLTWS